LHETPTLESRWDDLDYSLMEHDEGPFSVLYEPAACSAVDVQLEEDPYNHPYGFQPYQARLIAAGLALVTIVTPDSDSPFGGA
jgi:hypothetical protein